MVNSLKKVSLRETRGDSQYAQREDSLLRERHALWVADRAYVDMPFWDSQYRRLRQTVITRLKDNLIIEERKALDFEQDIINEGVLSDEEVTLSGALVTDSIPDTGWTQLRVSHQRNGAGARYGGVSILAPLG
ncbi:hypothetical protein [Microbulbifer sp. 2205BS26-8]|uniref:hypothetical protein n=1 Tax=Microbulbifer sp. 2205BS26-8 TaxID=3064386 RepID=UPI00273FA7AB|nr:hypothetical protein [Microbulbifer sp. 2205BS26-8]MDP5209569.1 hypothetical protein [Microbulbifer sp. 2205BS26-8]